MNEKIEKSFTAIPPTPFDLERFNQIRDKGKALALLIDINCPDSREKSLAITKIEEAVMWANKSISVNER